MPKINKVYPPFFNGVSQQNPELILDNQCKEMVNCVPDLVSGLTKRPPVKFKAVRDYATYPTFEDTTVFHTYDRGEDDEEYIFLEHDDVDDPVQIFNDNGTEMSITYDATNEQAIKDYLNQGNLKALTVQDRTWIFSKNAEVDLDYAATEPLNADYDKTAFYWLKRGSGDRYNPFNYAVYLDNITIACNPVKPKTGDLPDGTAGFEDSDFAAAYLHDIINRAKATSIYPEYEIDANSSETFKLYLGENLQSFAFTISGTSITSSSVSYNSTTGYVTFTITNSDNNAHTAFCIFEAWMPTGWNCERSGSILKIWKDGYADFTFSSWDSWGNQASEGWKGSVNKITDLPKDMVFDDVYVKIKGDEGNSFQEYFVKWNGSSWEECLDPAADRGQLTNMPIKCDRTGFVFDTILWDTIDPSTANAHYLHLKSPSNTSYDYDYETELSTIQTKLIDEGYRVYVYNTITMFYEYKTYEELLNLPSNTYKWVVFWFTGMGSLSFSESFISSTGTYAQFTLNLIDWSLPRVGNLENNPDPSFAPDEDGNQRTIQDLFFYKNRLGIASADSITLSETANYTNFYATTVTDIVDTDVIDITVATNQASKIYYAKPFNNSLYIFTKYAQYELVGEGGFTPSTVSLNNTTNYPMAVDVEPIVVNDSLYFVSTTNNRQQLREYIKTEKLNVKGIDLNTGTPTYLDKPIKKLVADGVLGYVLCCTANNTIYLYNFKEDGTNRVQSAWSTWTLFEGLETVEDSYEYYFIESLLLVMCKTANDYRYHVMQLDYDISNNNIDTSSSDGLTIDEYNYESNVILPDYYPKLTDVRTPKDKMLIKKISIEGEGAFDATVYRKDYNTTYTKSHTLGLKDLDLHVSSKIGNVEITIKDDSENDFMISSIVVEGLFSTTSKEMK